MKSKLAVLGFLSVASLGWAAPQEFKFVTTLSSPVASFKAIETKYTQAPTEFFNDSKVNLGSVKNEQGGTISIEGGQAVRITKLVMQENATFSVGNSNKWIVDTLTIGKDGVVEPQSAHIQTLQVPSGSTLKVEKKLKMMGPINITKEGSSVDSVVIGSGASQLEIKSLSTNAKTGTFKSLPCSPQNQTAGLCSSVTINVLEVQ